MSQQSIQLYYANSFISSEYSNIGNAMKYSYSEVVKKHFQTSLQDTYVKKSKKLLSKRVAAVENVVVPRSSAESLSSKKQRPQNDSLNSWIRQQGSEARPPLHRKSTNMLPKLVTYEWDNSSSNNSTNNCNRDINGGASGGTTTPKPVNTFHLKCIEDVMKHNSPERIVVRDPKELVYLKKLPYLKLSILGIGRTKDMLWELKNTDDSRIQ